MSTHPSSETAPKQGAPTRKAIPPRALLISGVLAAAVIGTAGYFATRPPAAPDVLTTAPVTVPAPITSTASTQDSSTPPVSTGSTPNTGSPTKPVAATVATNDPGRVRDPFAPAEDKATPATVSTPTTRIVTAPRAAAPVVQQSTPVVRAPGTAEPGIQVFTQPARNSTVVPQPAPVTTAPTAIVTAPNPVVTLTPVTPQASAVTPAVPQTSSIPPVREITVTSPAVVVTTPVAPVVIPSSTPTAGPVAALQTPVPAPASAPALNVTQQWLQDHRVTYGGRADSGENTTVILNTNEGQVFVDVGQVIPGTEVTLTSADNQNLVFTQKSKTAKLTIPASPTTDTGAQP